MDHCDSIINFFLEYDRTWVGCSVINDSIINIFLECDRTWIGCFLHKTWKSLARMILFKRQWEHKVFSNK